MTTSITYKDATGKVRSVRLTRGLEEELDEYFELFDCRHEQFMLVKFRSKPKAEERVKRQCRCCGELFGGFVADDGSRRIVKFNPQIAENYHDRRDAHFEEIMARHFKRQGSEGTR